MRAIKPQLDKPTTGWRADLPPPDCPPIEKLQPVGLPPNFVGDICLELHTLRLINRTVVVLCAFAVVPCSIVLLMTLSVRELNKNPLGFCLTLSMAIGMVLGAVAMLRTGIAPPRDEPIRFNRKRGKVYVYRFHSGGPISRKGWGIRPVVFNWEDLRAEVWSRIRPTPSGVPIFAWGVDLAVVAPGTNRVIDRFQLAGSNADGEHMWAMARAFMNQGPEALPLYPTPPRDWNNDVPPYHFALRLAPKVEWPADMDVESRTAP